MRKKTKGRIQRFEDQNRSEELRRQKGQTAERKTTKKTRINGGRMTLTVVVIVLVIKNWKVPANKTC